MKNDTFEVEILADGTLKISADKISAGNHVSAEALVREIYKLAGGLTTRTRKPHTHGTHSHTHGQEAGHSH
jgi:hypothetical protein